MNRNIKMTLSLFIASAALAACASKPPNMQAIPDTADATAEVEATQKMLNAAKDNNLDVFAPKNFSRAEENLAEAREALVKGKSKEKILDRVARSRGWLEEAEARGSVTRAASKDLSDARTGAVRATAPLLYPKEFKKLDEEARELAAKAEKGDIEKLTERGERLTTGYRNLEVSSVSKMHLGDARMNLQAAKKDGAEKLSPKTYEITESKISHAQAVINENPRNMSAITAASKDALNQSRFLLMVNQKTKEGNTEDLVLQSERQMRRLSGMEAGLAATEAGLAATEAELHQKNAALKTAAELRKSLKPNEAEVFVENNAVKVRLKGVQFSPNSTTINKKSASLLDRVDKVLGTVGASAISVEGHTDSTGTPETNREVSEKRAEAVQNYMINKGSISSNQIKAVGMGDESPISDNKTSRGRAENRRIDLVIEPKVE